MILESGLNSAVHHVPKLLNMKVFKSALLTKIDLNHGIMGTGIPDGGLLRYRK